MPLVLLHVAIDNMIPLIPDTYDKRDELVGLLEGKKQESLANVKTQKLLRRETDQILKQYLGPLSLGPDKIWVDEVTKAYYAQA